MAMPSLLSNLTHKQLFLTDCKIQNTEILINNKDLINQVRKVLRLQKGDTIYVQELTTNNLQLTIHRYEVEIKDWDDKTLMGKIKKEMEQIPHPSDTPFHKGAQIKKGMIIGMPNKREKVELIVQKLTEIGLDEIIFRPSERSVIKTWNENKAERLQKIAREAVEQSRGRTMPKIEFVINISKILKAKNVLIFDKITEKNLKESGEIGESMTRKKSSDLSGHFSDFGLVGPEGGLTERDYEALKGVKYEVRELGATMLRTETAAIVGGRIVKNGK